MNDVTTHIAINTPVMTKELFCELSRMRPGQLRGQIDRKNIHVIKIGRHPMVNVALLTWESTSRDNPFYIPCPIITAEGFSTVSGLPLGATESQMDERNLPLKYAGRLRFVDLSALYQTCLNQRLELVVK